MMLRAIGRAVLLGGLVLATHAAYGLPRVGETAPDFILPTIVGKNLKLSEQRGRVVLINFWATWCSPCRQELPLLNALYERYHAAGLEIWAVNIEEDSAKATKMSRDLGLRFPLLLDTGKRVSRRYDPAVMPSTVLVDRDGKVRYVHLGYKPGYEERYERQIRELLRE